MGYKPDVFEVIEIKDMWENAKLVIQQKRLGSTYQIDVRIWAKNTQTNDFFPLKKGICLSNQVFKDKIIPELNRLINQYT